jgi:hypothetical protein
MLFQGSQAPSHTREPDAIPNGTVQRPQERRRLTLLLTLCIAVLIAQVDTSVVNLAVRPIGEYFQTFCDGSRV